MPNFMEKAKGAKLYERTKNAKLYEKAKGAKLYERTKNAKLYEKAKGAKLYERAEGAKSYEKGQRKQLYERPCATIMTSKYFDSILETEKVCVNKGDLVAYQSYAMGRMKFIWGDDAEEYKPERWFDGDGFFREENPFKFTAFLAGLRICLGKEFSYKQMKIFYAVLFSS
ncbi:hypothetical protein HAX54_005171 [Datura stramonium]|uniref:Cytochrome P450 n=1 Tax=Datura stramonium TaxID=4076 RepID=A0ABS8T9P5_DATST|nr:hypothetical protein [Datura stramonium]